MASERPFHFIKDAAGLERVAGLVERSPEIGIDAEMNGLHAYRAHVCVLQIATEEADIVIDTIAVRELGALVKALTRPDVVRYAHGAAHDVKCLKTDFGFGIEGLFDTYVAAQMLGVEKLGYGDIVATRFGVPLDKRLQTTDWGKRPLSDEHIAYLRADIRFLIPLGRQLRGELAEKDLLEETAYEWTRVEALPPEEDVVAEDAYLRPREAKDLAPAELAALRELYLARAAIARRMDRPPFKVAGDSVLVQIAKRKPATPDELAKIQGLPRSGTARLAADLFAAMERGLAAGAPPPLPRPSTPRPDPGEIRARRAREDALRGWRKRVAAARGVPPMAVLPSYLIEDLVRHPPADEAELATRPGMIPKRVRMYARDLLALLDDATRANARDANAAPDRPS